MKGRYVLGAVLLAGATYFALFGGEYSLLEIARIRHEKSLEQERFTTVERDVQRLRARVDSLENDEPTMMRIARERWGLIRPGERLYRFDGTAPDSLEGDSVAPRPAYYRWPERMPEPRLGLPVRRAPR
ncbi:MAG: septum formation initiator family protein [Gemmatimonadota bacterium]|jgi:cell division protein FtsB